MVNTRSMGLPLFEGSLDRIRRSRRFRRYPKKYRSTDRAHRHRLPDPQRKTQHVISYTRRI